MSELSVLTERLDALAKGLEATAKGWAERFRLIERETTQHHRDLADLHEQAERNKKQRAVSTRVWIALIALAGTVANGTLQVINSNSRATLRAEIVQDLKSENAEIIKQAANEAVKASDRRFELQVKATK